MTETPLLSLSSPTPPQRVTAKRLLLLATFVSVESSGSHKEAQPRAAADGLPPVAALPFTNTAPAQSAFPLAVSTSVDVHTGTLNAPPAKPPSRCPSIMS